MNATTDAADSGQLQYLTFHLAGEEYGVGILKVKEILEYDTLTKVPAAPSFIRGVINLRGSVVPVIDLAVKFGLAASPITKRTCVVIVEADADGRRTVMGIIADSVSKVIDLAPGDIEPAPQFGTRVRSDHLQGMGKTGKKFALLLDIDRVLAADELAAAVVAETAAVAPLAEA
jgi:purine-binding chemotaxis protein CheW